MYNLQMDDFFEILRDVWDYLKFAKKYWLAPLIITTLLMELF